jgi:hypothetical protein
MVADKRNEEPLATQLFRHCEAFAARAFQSKFRRFPAKVANSRIVEHTLKLLS